MQRIPLCVIEKCDEDGEITPVAVLFDGVEYNVDRVISVSRHAPSVACVSPLRYDCVIGGRKKTLYRDSYPSQRWFSVK